MKLQLVRPLVCFDLESTGLDTQNDRIVEIGLVRLNPDGSRESIERRFDPGIDVPEAATRIHGIRNDDVRGLFGRPSLSKASDEILEFIGEADLAGFNVIGYDLPLWLAEVERHQLAFELGDRAIIDGKIIFDAKEPSWDRFIQGPRNLNNAVLHFCGRSQAAEFAQRDAGEGDSSGVSLEEQNRHSAVKDADATLDVILAQLERYEDLPTAAAALGTWCTETHEQRARAS